MDKQSRPKILIVDDDPRVRRVCRRFLTVTGHEIAEVGAGDEAVKRLKEKREAFDIVLTDLEMPGTVNGNELTRQVREQSNADVIIMTGNPELQTAIRALQDGAYDYLIKPFSDETLQHAIRRCLDKRSLSKELAKEKALRTELERAYTELSTMERMRDTFGQFVTPEVARFVLAHPRSISDEGDQRSLTVLFGDARGFTTFAEKVSPREAVATLNQIFACMIEAFNAEGGILSKFLGDGVMALFGAPTPLENHAVAAAKAALAAMRSIESLARSREEKGLIPLRLGIGINTGEMIAGCLGTAERTEYSVIGGAVNLASRLESVAKPGQILVGPETARLLSCEFELRDHGQTALKGLGEQIRVAELLGWRGEVLRQDAG